MVYNTHKSFYNTKWILCSKVAAFVSTTQMHAKGYRGMLYTCAVAVKTDDYQIQRKLSRICHESSAGIELGGRLVQNNWLAALKRRVFFCAKQL